MVDLDRIEAFIEQGAVEMLDEGELEAAVAELRTIRARVAEVERDAAAWAKVREAIGDDAHLFEAFAEPVRREHADTGIERAPVYDRVPVAIADALRAEEGGE